jgi:hypothetical protein
MHLIDNLRSQCEAAAWVVSLALIPGLPRDVSQRGSGRAQTFFRDDDFALYRDLLTPEILQIWAWHLGCCCCSSVGGQTSVIQGRTAGVRGAPGVAQRLPESDALRCTAHRLFYRKRLSLGAGRRRFAQRRHGCRP